jgi:hypothetical protein
MKMADWSEAIEKEGLAAAEADLLTLMENKKIKMFFVNDKFYIFDDKTNKKILCSSIDNGFNYIAGKIQERTNEDRKVLSPANEKRIKKAMHTYIPRHINFTYNPSRSKVIIEDGLSYYNTFQPSFYSDKPITDPYLFPNPDNPKIEPFMFPTIEDFFNNFFQEIEEKRWFLERLAYTIQNPEDRLPTALLLTGVKGSGKDTLKTIIEKTLGTQNVFNLDQSALESSFNAYIGKSQVIFCNEIHNWKDPTRIFNILKNFATNKKITVNEKFMPPYTANNYAFMLLATNDFKFRPVDESDRRYSVFFQDKKLDENISNKSFESLMDLINNPEHENETYSEFHYFYWYLCNLEIKDINFIRKPLKNKYREQMIKANLGGNIDFGIISDIIKKIVEEPKNNMKEKKILAHNGKYYIKPKYLIEGFIAEKQHLNEYKEKKHKVNYDNVKHDLIGSLWFKDFTDCPIKFKDIEIKQKTFQIVEPRLIAIIEGKSTENIDDQDAKDTLNEDEKQGYEETLTEQQKAEKKRQESEAGETIGE